MLTRREKIIHNHIPIVRTYHPTIASTNDKTELMLVTSRRTKHLHYLPTSITIGNAKIPF